MDAALRESERVVAVLLRVVSPRRASAWAPPGAQKNALTAAEQLELLAFVQLDGAQPAPIPNERLLELLQGVQGRLDKLKAPSDHASRVRLAELRAEVAFLTDYARGALAEKRRVPKASPQPSPQQQQVQQVHSGPAPAQQLAPQTPREEELRLRDKVQELSEVYNEVTAELLLTQRANQELLHDNQQLKTGRAAAAASAHVEEAFEGRNRALHEELQSLHARNRDLELQLKGKAVVEQELMSMEARNQELQSEAALQRAELAALKGQVSQFRRDIASDSVASEQTALLRAQLDESRKAQQALQDALQGAQHAHKKDVEKFARAQTEHEAERKRMLEVGQQIDELLVLGERRAGREADIESAEQTRSDFEKLRRAKFFFQQRIAELEQELSERSQALEAAETVRQALMMAYEQERGLLDAGSLEVRSQLTDYEKVIQNMIRERTTSFKQVREQEAEITRVTAELAALQTDHALLQTECETHRLENKDLGDRLERAEAQLTDMHGSLVTRDSQITRHKDLQQDLSARKEALNRQVSQVEEERDTAVRRLAGAKETVEAFLDAAVNERVQDLSAPRKTEDEILDRMLANLGRCLVQRERAFQDLASRARGADQAQAELKERAQRAETEVARMRTLTREHTMQLGKARAQVEELEALREQARAGVVAERELAAVREELAVYERREQNAQLDRKISDGERNIEREFIETQRKQLEMDRETLRAELEAVRLEKRVLGNQVREMQMSGRQRAQQPAADGGDGPDMARCAEQLQAYQRHVREMQKLLAQTRVDAAGLYDQNVALRRLVHAQEQQVARDLDAAELSLNNIRREVSVAHSRG